MNDHRMAVYVRKGLEIPEPSDCSSSEDDDRFTDLYQPKNQSVKMNNKMLNNLVDREDISEQDRIRRDAHTTRKVPVLNPSKEIKFPARTNCIACSDDGVYLFLGHTHGLSVITTSTLTCLRTWKDERVELTSISCTSLGNCTHLLCTVDDMGIARLFVHHVENIYLIKVINETEDINQRHNCAKFEVSGGGDFGAAVMTSSGSVWLDVYRFPQDVWLKELETKQATHSPGATDAKLSPVVLLMKIKPLEIPAGTSLKSPFDVLQKTEEGILIGSGQNHLISSHQWENQDVAFRKMFVKYLSSSPKRSPKMIMEGPSNCTFHFLLREGFCSLPRGAKATRDIPIAVCLWWSCTHNLLQYPLLKTHKEKPDSEPRPDMLWPNSQEILCSAVSASTRFIVLGLVGQLVTIWDRKFGCPYGNIVIPGDSAICELKLILQSPKQLPVTPQGPFVPRLQVMLICRSGACYSVTVAQGGDTNTAALIERPADPGSFTTVAEPVPFLKCLTLLMQKNGQLSILDIEDGAPVCSLNLPQTHALGSLWEPVYALEPVQQNLYIRGDRKTPSAGVKDSGMDESSLFIFSFSECSLMDPYQVTSSAATERDTRATFSNLEEACNLYIQERADSLEERNKNVAFRWEQLQKHVIK
ncbi:WD repeat-containing protein 93 [Xyrauchen texanus]|uniref:WD repeat-containing protein 93 n=1 Tax=Xyrauchen texanus TaxID=154827 RepID=UPI002241E979|nr:WD repeat-containing protein 93 [Xyrauchen texanus]